MKSIEKGITAIFLKLGPFDLSTDRRVSASLVFLRAQTDPFGPVSSAEVRANRATVPENVEQLMSYARQR